MSYNASRGPPAIEGMTSLKVDNLTYRTTIEELKRVFQKYGDVGDVYIPRQKDGESRGFAFVRFYEKRDAEDAMEAVDGAVLDGREIRVQNAKYGRPTHNPRSRRGGSRGRYDRGNDRYDHRDSRSNRRSHSPRRRRSRSRSNSPRRRSSPRRRRSRSRSQSPRRRPQSRSPQQTTRQSESRSPRKQRSRSASGSPKRRSQSPAATASPEQKRSKSPSPTNDE